MSKKKNYIELTRRNLIAGASAIVGTSLTSSAWAEDQVVVIVNKNNKEEPSRSDLAAMFTTRKQSWGGGVRVVPFNFPARHEVRVQFDKEVLKMDPDDVARYWIDRRIRGGNAPPKQIPSAQLIVKLVQKFDGAVAYVPKSFATDDVRIVSEL